MISYVAFAELEQISPIPPDSIDALLPLDPIIQDLFSFPIDQPISPNKSALQFATCPPFFPPALHQILHTIPLPAEQSLQDALSEAVKAHTNGAKAFMYKYDRDMTVQTIKSHCCYGSLSGGLTCTKSVMCDMRGRVPVTPYHNASMQSQNNFSRSFLTFCGTPCSQNPLPMQLKHSQASAHTVTQKVGCVVDISTRCQLSCRSISSYAAFTMCAFCFRTSLRWQYACINSNETYLQRHGIRHPLSCRARLKRSLSSLRREASIA